MKILGIETSCDETSAAVIEIDTSHHISVQSNIVASSLALHAKTGGIIPEIAAREQLKYIILVINEALEKSGITKDKGMSAIDAIAVTVGPGLIGSLLVGVETAKTLALLWKKPLIPVNHLFGHVYAPFIGTQIPQKEDFPAIGLIVSGGHTDLVLFTDEKKLTWLSGTRDDAAGEAFDKIGRLLGLPYPAGPTIEKLAAEGNPKRFHFPRPLLHEDTLDFSFSGLKTAALREVENIQKKQTTLDQQTRVDICRATQDAICDVLVFKTYKAAAMHNARAIFLGGGVAANQALTQAMMQKANKEGLHLFVPERKLCTDNAAMIAAAAYYHTESVAPEGVSANPELYFD